MMFVSGSYTPFGSGATPLSGHAFQSDRDQARPGEVTYVHAHVRNSIILVNPARQTRRLNESTNRIVSRLHFPSGSMHISMVHAAVNECYVVYAHGRRKCDIMPVQIMCNRHLPSIAFSAQIVGV